MKLNNLKVLVVKKAARGGLLAKKYSPEILLGLGVIGIVASTVMACKATIKAESVLDIASENMDKINHAKENASAEYYTDQDFKKDKLIVFTQTSVEFVKIYGPAVTLGIASIGCVLGAHNIMRKRNIALAAAYNLIEKGFSDYRRRVVNELGDEKDKQFRYGTIDKTITTTTVDKKGKEITKEETVKVIDPNGTSVYAKWYDDSNPNWLKSAEYNLMTLKGHQNYLNDLLHARGHVFLNEAYELLGFKHTEAGALVGWAEGNGDDFIDFGIFDKDNRAKREFVNGYNEPIMIDFNVDGLIYNII